MDNDMYTFYKSELLKRKTYPYWIDERTGTEFYSILVKEVPSVRFYNVDGMRPCITYDSRAEKRLRKIIEDEINECKRRLNALELNLRDIEESTP